MRPKASFIFLNAPQAPPYEVDKDRLLIGRSKNQADLTIEGDPYISRIHAQVDHREGRFTIRNLGRNPLLINGQARQEHVMENNDVIQLGKTEIRFKKKEETAVKPEGPGKMPVDAETLFVAGESGKNPALSGADNPAGDNIRGFGSDEQDPAAPKLVRTDSLGEVKTFTLDVDAILIGRTLEADIRLNDPSVSRRHCAMSRIKGVFYLKNLSKTNPIRINGREIGNNGSGARLYSGDRILLGENVFTFLSNSAQDVPPVKRKAASATFRPGLAAIILALALILVVGGYAAYSLAYLPWREKSTVESIGRKAREGLLEEARQEAAALLETDLSGENRMKAKKILAETTESIAILMEADGDLAQAKEFIASYLKTFGDGEQSEPLRAKMDELTMRGGRLLESGGRLEDAVNEYASIGSESRHYDEAQASIMRILDEIRMKGENDANLAVLLEKAERRFVEKKYLTPPDENAYEIYRAVLEIDAQNQTALGRMRQMKEFYRDSAMTYYNSGNCRRALTLFERSLVIDPQDPDIRRKVEICRRNLGAGYAD